MRIALIIFIYLLSSILKSQNTIKIDGSLTPDKILCRDTSYWFDYADTTREKLIPYPNNSKITFNQGFEFGDTIPNCTVNLKNDTLFIHLFKLTYGLKVYLDIIYVNGILKTKLVHDRGNIGIMRTFKVERCELSLNKNGFKKGETLVGKINLSFSGSTIGDMTSYKEKKVKGQITGLFKSIVE